MRRWRLASTSTLAIVTTSLLSREAVAANERFTVEWVAPDACPKQDAVSSDIERILGPYSSPQSVRPLAARVQVTVANPSIWRAEVEFQGSSERRILEGDSCDEIARAVAVIVAIAVREEVKEETPVERPRVEPEPESRVNIAGTVGGAVFADLGSQPSLSPGALVRSGIQLGPNALLAEISALFPQRAFSASDATKGADFFVAGAAVRIERSFALTPQWDVSPATEFRGNWIRASGFGTRFNRDANELTSSIGGGLIFRWHAGRVFSLSLRADVMVPLTRPSFEVDPAGTVFRPPPISWRIGIGPDVRF